MTVPPASGLPLASRKVVSPVGKMVAMAVSACNRCSLSRLLRAMAYCPVPSPLEDWMRAWIAISVLLALAGCQADQTAQRENFDKVQDQQCRSFGAKPGSSDYIHCRETLLGQAQQRDLQRRQVAAAYFARRPPLAPYQMTTTYAPVRRPLNCNSIQTGNFTSTNCY